MPLESCIMCLDVSEYMRNGDYAPTRLDAQYDAACLLGGAKLQQNPESSVGVLSSGGKGVNVLASPTTDLGKLLACLHGLSASGASSLITSVKTAQLALKHRKNRSGTQRIICVVGSPVEEDERELKRLGAFLKKSSIALDIIAVGENEGNAPKLQAFVEAADSGANSRLLLVPAGVLPSDVLAGHAILHGDDAAAGAAAGAARGGGGGGGAQFQEYGGVDPAMDPELAMALRVSMEEARAAARDDATVAGGPAAAAPAPGTTAAPSAAMDLSEEDLLLQQALALSASEEPPTASAPASAAVAVAAPVSEGATAAPPLMAAASSATSSTGVGASGSSGSAAAPAPAAPEATGAFSNPDFVQTLLGGLPGVDLSDPALQEAMRALMGGGQPPGGSGSGGAPPPAGGSGGDSSSK